MYIILFFKGLKLSTEGNFSKAILAMYRLTYAFMYMIQLHQGVTPSDENKMWKVFELLNNLRTERIGML